jgi:L-rhamnose-H+ transport protein
MNNMLDLGALLAILSGVMNGLFTLPMRFLGRWPWENVWSIFIAGSCLALPAALITAQAPSSWSILLDVPLRAVMVAVLTGFAWGFGAIMFGQSVSAIGIALSNTFVLAISSALGSLLPMLYLSPHKIHERAGKMILGGITLEIVGIALCGRAGLLRERSSRTSEAAQRGDLVGKARPLRIALLLVLGSGLLSAVFNIGFALAHPIAEYGQQRGLSLFASTNLIWVLIMGGGAVSNIGFCSYLLIKNHSASKFYLAGSLNLFLLSLLMAALWGGSIFVYGAAAIHFGALGTSIGWPLSLATGLLVANAVGLLLGEWKDAPRGSQTWMLTGIAVLLFAIMVLGHAS